MNVIQAILPLFVAWTSLMMVVYALVIRLSILGSGLALKFVVVALKTVVHPRFALQIRFSKPSENNVKDD